MQDLTLVIPAKFESESLPIFLKEISEIKCKKLIVLEKNDKHNKLNKNFTILNYFIKRKGYGAAFEKLLMN